MSETDPTAPDTSAAPDTVTASDENAALKAELEAARAETVDLKDKFIRAKAEAENIRRRAELDIASAHKFGVERFAMEIVSVRDSLELARAVEIKDDPAVQKMHEGLDLTLKQLDTVFQKFGIRQIDPKGEKFDPNRHQAISTVETADTPASHVANVVQKGYLLHDRVLRPAMVVVAREKPAENAEKNDTAASPGA